VEERHAERRIEGRVNLYAKLQQRKDNPLRIGLIGAGKFAAMYLAQVPRTPGIRLVAIADLSPANARANLERVGWLAELVQRTPITEDWHKVVSNPEIDIVIEATGNPPAAVEHALAAFEHGKHVVMVTVEADAFCGPLLARKAAQAGVVYSLAYGDQPALICDLVDWARAAGFPVVAAGRGHKWLPHFAQSTPETVWGYYGLTPEQAKLGGLNPKMFNSFLDGSKPAIETTSVCNATGLTPAPEGLLYPPAAIDEIPSLMRPRSEGGVLHHKGQVEVVSSLRSDGTPIPYDIRFGVFVVFEGETEYIQRCFSEYGVKTDPSGRYACLYKRWHLIGLEVGISVASVGLRNEPTGCATGWRADAVAVAKRNLNVGEILDGEGGYTVVGRLMPAAESLSANCLPLGLAHGWKLLKPVAAGAALRWSDVACDEKQTAVRVRREMESSIVPDSDRSPYGRPAPAASSARRAIA
jgi:predicted homoserine dehydrogenase-like protein